MAVVALGENGGSRQISRASGCDATGTISQQEAARAATSLFATPAPRHAIEAWLAELSVVTARRRSDDFEAALTVRAYADRLASYPADVVRQALLGTTWHFWPSWAELEVRCDTLVAT